MHLGRGRHGVVSHYKRKDIVGSRCYGMLCDK